MTSRSSASIAGSSLFRPLKRKLAGVVGRRDGRGIGQVQSGQLRAIRRVAPQALSRPDAEAADQTGWLDAPDRRRPPASP